MNRTLRRLAALLALGALVFAQLAVSAHACHAPMQGPVAATLEAPPPAHCPDMQPGPDTQENLCEQHCQYGSASLDKCQSPVALFDPSAPALRVAGASAEAQGAPTASRHPATRTATPPAILFRVLRI